MKKKMEDRTRQERQRLLKDIEHSNEQEHTKYGVGLAPATMTNERLTGRQAPTEATMKVPSKTTTKAKRKRKEEERAH